jgi:hypothetical protein
VVGVWPFNSFDRDKDELLFDAPEFRFTLFGAVGRETPLENTVLELAA